MEAVTDTEGFDLEQSLDTCANLLKDPAHHMLVARDRDAVVGFINFSARRTLTHSGPSGLIDELVVS